MSYRPTSGECRVVVDLAQRPSSLAALPAAQAPDRQIYLGFVSGSHLHRYDPVARTITDLGPIRPHSGPITALAPVASGRVYVAVHNTLYSYDQNASPAVREIYARPDGLAIVALAVAADGRVYMGTNGLQGNGSEGLLLVFDPATGVVEQVAAPAPHAGAISSLTVGSDGAIYGQTGGWGKTFRYDPVARSTTIVIDRPPHRHGQLFRLDSAPDGQIYATGDNAVFSFAPSTGEAAMLWQGNENPAGARGVLVTSTGDVYFGASPTGRFMGYTLVKRSRLTARERLLHRSRLRRRSQPRPRQPSPRLRRRRPRQPRLHPKHRPLRLRPPKPQPLP